MPKGLLIELYEEGTFQLTTQDRPKWLNITCSATCTANWWAQKYNYKQRGCHSVPPIQLEKKQPDQNKNGWDWNEVLPNHGSSSPYFVSRGSPDPQTQQDMSRYLWTWHITCCFTYLFYFYLISSVWYQHQELVGTHIEARTVAFRNRQSFKILAISQLKSIKTPIKTS